MLTGPLSAPILDEAERLASEPGLAGKDVRFALCGLCGDLSPLSATCVLDDAGPVVRVTQEKPCAECNTMRRMAPGLAEWVDRVIGFHLTRYHEESPPVRLPTTAEVARLVRA